MQSARMGDRPGSLRRMWFQFELPSRFREAAARNGGVIAITADLPSDTRLPTVLTVGCGVTGYDEDDCLDLIRAEIFDERPLPEMRSRVPDIDVSTLPEPLQRHLGSSASRGVWFPPVR